MFSVVLISHYTVIHRQLGLIYVLTLNFLNRQETPCTTPVAKLKTHDTRKLTYEKE